jgi:molybdopterin biosynthesis enzyme MoaB
LSRGVSGTRGLALILNLAGSTSGAVEMLDAVIDVVPHAIALLADNAAPHPHPPPPH